MRFHRKSTARLHADFQVVTLLLAVFAVGAGTGALVAGPVVHEVHLLLVALPGWA